MKHFKLEILAIIGLVIVAIYMFSRIYFEFKPIYERAQIECYYDVIHYTSNSSMHYRTTKLEGINNGVEMVIDNNRVVIKGSINATKICPPIEK